MLTRLAEPGVRAVGALLTLPDGIVQHGGPVKTAWFFWAPAVGIPSG
jgi:hypothetical protein